MKAAKMKWMFNMFIQSSDKSLLCIQFSMSQTKFKIYICNLLTIASVSSLTRLHRLFDGSWLIALQQLANCCRESNFAIDICNSLFVAVFAIDRCSSLNFAIDWCNILTVAIDWYSCSIRHCLHANQLLSSFDQCCNGNKFLFKFTVHVPSTAK